MEEKNRNCNNVYFLSQLLLAYKIQNHGLSSFCGPQSPMKEVQISKRSLPTKFENPVLCGMSKILIARASIEFSNVHGDFMLELVLSSL